jgi:small-conductance mechanosensitive channel
MEETLRNWLLDPRVHRVVLAIVVFFLIFVTTRVLQRSISRYVKGTETRYRARKAVGFLGYVVAALVVAAIVSDRIGGLGIALGVAGAGVAFALQEVIASIAGWVAVSFGSFYGPGDRIEVGSIRGDVIDIGILRTTLMELGGWVDGDLYNGRIVRVANSAVLREPVFNYSADFPFLWDEITFPLRYGSDWKYMRDTLSRVVTEVIGDYAAQSKDAWKNVVRKYRIEEARIEPMITLQADENWIEYRVRYIVDYRLRRTTKDRLFARILEEVDASEGRIGFANASFEIVSLPPVEMELRRRQAAAER